MEYRGTCESGAFPHNLSASLPGPTDEGLDPGRQLRVPLDVAVKGGMGQRR